MYNVTSTQRAPDCTVIWAIDPSSDRLLPNPLFVHRLIQLFYSAGVKVQPVQVRSSGDKKVVPSELTNQAEDELKTEGAVGVEKTIVISANSTSHANEVLALLAFADGIQPAIVMVSSHGRSGVERAYMGSFAESLLATSKYPVLFLTDIKHDAHIEQAISRALFATDFSENSKTAFEKFLKLAKRLDLDITIFNAVSLPSLALAADYGIPVLIPGDYFSDQTDFANKEGERWLGIAASFGVSARLIVKYEGIGPNLEQDIQAVAESQKADMIVMSSTAGPFASLLLGNVARDTYRSHSIPVCVYGPAATGDLPERTA